MEAPTIPRASKNDAARVKFIKNTQPAILAYAQASKKAGAVLDPTTDPIAKGRLLDTETFLTWLEESVDMNPALKKQSNLPTILSVIYARAEFHFPEDLRRKAQALHEKWDAENWGAPAKPEPQPGGGVDTEDVNDDRGEEDDDGGNPRGPVSRRESTARSGNTRTHYPPPTHTIWGRKGIFHGLAKKVNIDTGRATTVFNDQLLSSKKDPKVYGHNGLTVGQWFPSQLSALWHGAVGSSQGGMSGHTANGAYSIVVSGAYEDLDTDNGEVLYYSGSGSHENTDPKNHKESTTGTKCLKASYYSGKPVRVVRTASKSMYSPTVGLRYDGLYKVVSMNRPRNNNGGLYEQFRLERIDDKSNGNLEEDCRERPTAREQRDYGERDVKYW